MPHFKNDGLSLYYEVHGIGTPVVMLHGGAVTFAGNFGVCGWIERMNARGLQVVGPDGRGHGRSEVSPAGTGFDVLAGDVVALLDHLGIERAAVVGYSVGSAVALHALHRYPSRFTAGALVATGDGLIGYPPYTFAELMPHLVDIIRLPEFPADLPVHQAMYWTFATQVAGDRDAVAMASGGDFKACTIEEAGSIDVPVLVVSAENDPVLGTGPRLAKALAKGRYLEIQGADHFSLALDEDVQKEVAAFLA